MQLRPIHTQPSPASHAITSSMLCHPRFLRYGSSSHGISVFALCLAATLIASDVQSRSLVRKRVRPCIAIGCLDLSVLICFCDKSYYLSTHLCPIPDLEPSAIPLINCDGYLCVPPIYTHPTCVFALSILPCVSRSITCSFFPLFFFTQFPRNAFSFHFSFPLFLLFNIVFQFPSGHIYRALRMYAYLPSWMYPHPR